MTDLPAFADQLVRTGLPRRLFEIARDEDLGERGDMSSLVSIASETVLMAQIGSRQAGVLAGLAFAQLLADAVAPGVVIEPVAKDGQRVSPGDVIGVVRGPVRSVLAVERPMLNLLGRLSGIATLTRQAVAQTEGTRAQVCDTRKTTPGLRVLEKYAVACGGGTSHRMGLHDAVMLKDNHLAAMRREGEPLASAIERAANDARTRFADVLQFVQIECDTLEQFSEVLKVRAGLVDMVLLDNMDCDTLRQAVAMRGDRAIGLEASGGITINTLAEVARTGIDRVSLGQLTTQATGLDFGLDHTATIPARAPEPPLNQWADALEAELGVGWKVAVVAQTASTQDAARKMASADHRLLVIAGEQTAGRGRLGRAWRDSRGCSLAMSIALAANGDTDDLLGIVGGLALCAAAHRLVPGYDESAWASVALRWPNDAVHVASGRKLGGVLVESANGVAVVGLGLNVGQLATLGDWPKAIAGRATSLAELGSTATRLDAATAVLDELARLLELPREELLKLARQANAMRGKRHAFTHNGKRHEGVVGVIDHDGAIELMLDDGRGLHLPAATTSLVHEG